MITIVYLRFNVITGFNVFRHLGGFVGIKPHFLSVLPFDEIEIVLDAQHLALDCLANGRWRRDTGDFDFLGA